MAQIPFRTFLSRICASFTAAAYCANAGTGIYHTLSHTVARRQNRSGEVRVKEVHAL